MRPSWAIAALSLVVAACGAADGNRFDLTTPGAHTGNGVPAATSAPNPTATPEATPKAKEEKKAPVTRTERRIIKGWSDSLRRGQVGAAARYFSVPTRISDAEYGELFLSTPAEVEQFNRNLTCATKLVRTRRGVDGFVVGIFMLTERKGQKSCGGGVGKTTAVAFQIRKRHIQQWVRIDVADVEPTPTPTASPTGTPRTS